MRQDRRSDSQSGMVTAEFAVTIPAVAAVLVLILSAIAFSVAQGQACYAARTVAREQAISQGLSGAAPARPSEGSVALTDPQLDYRVYRSGDLITVRVRLPTRFLPAATCEATAIAEPHYR